MKRILVVLAIVFFGFSLNNGLSAQIGGLLNKVKSKVADKVLGNSSSGQNSGNDPACACSDAVVILKMSESIKLDYKESVFSVLDDGTILVFSKLENKYYLVKNGGLEGPYDENSPLVKQFDNPEEGQTKNMDDMVARYKGLIVPSGEKYSIVFGGKTYGPYAIIQNFAVNSSGTQFAAIVTKDMIMTEDQGKKMEKAMNNAKTDQERMQLAMQMNQQMQEKMMAGGGPADMSPQMVSNVPGAVYNMMTMGGATLSSKIKYDEIVYAGFDKIMDLTGKVLTKIDPEKANSAGNYWLSSDNSRFASFNYGTISFSDGKQLSEIFCPYVLKQNGQVFISYMYFSPKNNAIMQCIMPF